VSLKDAYYAPWPIQRASVNIPSGTSESEVVAAVPGRRIRVMAFFFVCGDTGTTAVFLSASDPISPLIDNAANGGAAPGESKLGWFETERGEPLKVTTGAGSATGVHVVYALV